MNHSMIDLTTKVKRFADTTVGEWVSQPNNLPDYPENLIIKMKDLGLFGLNIPSEFGGLDVAPKVIFALIRELAKGFVPLTGALGSHLKVCQYIVQFGTADQKQRILPNMAAGEIIAAHAYTESQGKSLATLQTTLTLKQNKLILQGHKILVTNAANADLIVVVSRDQTIDNEKNLKTAIILLPSNQPGLSVGPDIPRLGMEGITLCELNFECEIEEEQVLGGLKFDGKKAIEAVQIDSLINYIARAVGLAEAVVKETTEYVNTKKSGDGLLKNIPAVQNKLSVMKGKLDEEEKVFERLNLDFGRKNDLLKYAYRSKALLSESTVDIARMGLALHGGAGYTKKYAIERHLREAIGLMLIGTPNDIGSDPLF